MLPLLERLSKGEILVSDGAMGTMLFERGLKSGDCPEKINLEKPETLTEIAALYAGAGADIVSTNTFGGSPLKLAQYGLDGKTEEINVAAIRAARQAIDNRSYIAASVGPCGRLLEPYGDCRPEEVSGGFRRQLEAIFSEAVDAVFVETMTDINEAILTVKAAKDLSPSTPVSASMTFDETPRGFLTIMGVSVEQACKELGEAGADIVGSNCGNGIENMTKIAAEFALHTTLPIIIQSNAGLPAIVDGKPIYSETPEFMAANCDQLLDSGVRIIGGCCGTTPEHIASIRKVVSRRTLA
ncbi:MAG: homocysteine S-methyltransferase family protein [Candidatus Zixiibacteriota bacterium]|nr:MAG: homocysteine S-methyltransferase family protein [candidate division Zixibacteria bacterium]